MAIKKILCPIDFSPQSGAAMDYAVALARDTGAELMLLHVAEPAIALGEAVPQMPDTAECRRELAAVIVDPEIRVDRRVVVGYAAEQILASASQRPVDLIVMGTHGRTGFSHLLMGSVAECVVRKASCPVLTLKAAVPTSPKVPSLV